MNKKDRELYGLKLRVFMKKEGVSSRECAYEVGCTERSILRWLKGETYPMLVFREKLSEMFPKLGNAK